MISGSDIVTSFVFFLSISKNIIDNESIEGTNEFTALEQALQQVTQLTQTISGLQTTVNQIIAVLENVISDQAETE